MSLHNNKPNRCLARHHGGFVSSGANDMNTAPSANIAHSVIVGDLSFLTRWRLGLYVTLETTADARLEDKDKGYFPVARI